MTRLLISLCTPAVILLLLPESSLGQDVGIAEALVETLSEQEGLSEEAIPVMTSPVDINSPGMGVLTEIGLISPVQQSALQLYIAVNGKLISLYELQAVPFFELESIRRILPYIKIGEDRITGQKINRSLATGKNDLLMRLSQTLQRQKGYREDGAYLGSRQRVFVRFMHTGKRISFGFLAEKDAGEPWIDRNRKQILDFNSFHVRLNEPLEWIDEVIIGDFNTSLGAGLVMNSSFRSGKSAMTTGIYSTSLPFRPLRSAREYDFLRGIGMTLSPYDRVKLHLIASRRRSDATVHSETVIDGADTAQYISISSLSASGLHRTISEQNRKNSIVASVLGLTANIDLARLNIQSNIVRQSASIPLLDDKRINPGRSTLNSSIHFRYLLRNALLFGEVALDERRHTSIVGGAMIPLSKVFDLAFQFRRLHPDYEHRGARTFAENTRAENETGLYMGCQFEPLKHFRVNAYTDFWKHPKARFGIDFPSTGREHLVRLTYSVRKKFELYLQWRSETKEYNSNTDTDRRITQLADRNRQYLRLHFARHINRDLELRNRLELSRFKLGDSEPEKGILFIQDLLYKPLGKPFNVTLRLAYFDTDSYNARIYAYENDLSYQFSIPAYAGNGTRFYFNLKYKGIRNTTIEFRMAHTQMFNRNTIGSGNDLIDGPSKTDVKVQVGIRI